MPILLSEDITLRHRRKDLAPPEAHEVIRRDHRAPQILLHQL